MPLIPTPINDIINPFANPGGTLGKLELLNPVHDVGAAVGAVGGPVTAVKDTATALKVGIQAITNPNFWLRVGEFLLGLALMIVGAAHMSHAVNAAVKAAPAVGKVLAK